MSHTLHLVTVALVNWDSPLGFVRLRVRNSSLEVPQVLQNISHVYQLACKLSKLSCSCFAWSLKVWLSIDSRIHLYLKKYSFFYQVPNLLNLPLKRCVCGAAMPGVCFWKKKRNIPIALWEWTLIIAEATLGVRVLSIRSREFGPRTQGYFQSKLLSFNVLLFIDLLNENLYVHLYLTFMWAAASGLGEDPNCHAFLRGNWVEWSGTSQEPF